MQEKLDATHMVPALEFDNVTFSYPEGSRAVLQGASVCIPQGSFVLLTGDTGSGKTTLLRLAKREIRPVGDLGGTVRALGLDVSHMDARQSAQTVGYVFQRPENQVVCDSVWHEMAFGLENLKTPRATMRRRIAETCTYLGMEPWFRARVDELSGGQIQALALASVLVMQPRILLLDEPTSMLDPVAERRFLALLFQLNRDLGITVVVATHAPWRMASYATHVLHLVGGHLENRDILSVKEENVPVCTRELATVARTAVEVRDAWLRYERDGDWILRGVDLQVYGGSVHALVGNNGSGKSTLLSVMAGVARPQRGVVRNESKTHQALLPQDPKMLLACQSVREELGEWVPSSQRENRVRSVCSNLGISDDVLDLHPYDLSGGQQQLVALGKLLACEPRLLLLDEPTKGLDLPSRKAVAQAVLRCVDSGVTVVVATHDLAFCREVADTVSLLFDGQIASTESCEQYFSQLWLH